MKPISMTQIGMLTLALAISASALAGQPRDERQPPMPRFMQQLDLSETQRDELKNLWDEARVEREAKREAMQARINSILTPEQQAQLEERRSEGARHQRGDKRERCNMERPERGDRDGMREERRQPRNS
ncbi:MAG: hypothetical protein ACK4L8_16225 [Nitrincola lacisaponensis]|uniref:hypothetical protein n=1 Tax=Nitrincola lacisaponensis TaxID=267850 RepID=UPI00391CF634